MALDLITFRGPIDVIERSSTHITAAFRDAAAFLDVIPTNIFWRLDDEGGCVLADWTVLTPAAASVSVPITALQNRILNEARDIERKQLTVMADRGLATQFAAVYSYAVRNQPWPS